MKTLSIIIPVFNEEKTVEKLLKQVSGIDLGSWKREVIVVDDGSTDKTSQILSKFSILNFQFSILKHKKNKGKGAAVQTGLKHVSGDAVIVQDADLEYNPNDIPSLLRKMEKTGSQIVMGNRNLKLKDHILYIWGINLSTLLLNLLYGSKISDLYTCYKLYNTKALKNVSSKAKGFEWDIEIMTKLLKKDYKASETPINYQPRSFIEGKKIKPWDGLVGLWVIIKNRF